MSNRKDNKGRVLHRGEGQRPDGRYSFSSRHWCPMAIALPEHRGGDTPAAN